jgi:ElaA protein
MTIEQVTFDSPLGRQAAALRFAVFVDEQKVPASEEIDHYDPDAVHLVAIEDGKVVGTLRLVAKENGLLKIGRVAVSKPHRRLGFGKQLMLEAIAYARAHKFRACILGAQVYVISFYEKLGFTAHGPVYDDCGIDHRDMRLDLP